MTDKAKPNIPEGTGWMGNPSRGAAIGRLNQLPDDRAAAPKLHLAKMEMEAPDYCYDKGGTYWGGWSWETGRMYVAWGEWADQEIMINVRARDHEEAREKVKALLPNAKFYR